MRYGSVSHKVVCYWLSSSDRTLNIGIRLSSHWVAKDNTQGMTKQVELLAYIASSSKTTVLE